MDKKQLSESDICDKFIGPAMEQAGWHGLDQIYREFLLRAGHVSVRGNKAHRDQSTVLRADYALFFKANIPIAMVEAKDNNKPMGSGMAQAINYADLLGVPFCFASNGDGFVFRDATLADGVLEKNLTLDEFPSPQDLWERYCVWKGWTPAVRQVAEFDYAPSKTPRYYQINAINRTVEAIANPPPPSKLLPCPLSTAPNVLSQTSFPTSSRAKFSCQIFSAAGFGTMTISVAYWSALRARSRWEPSCCWRRAEKHAFNFDRWRA